MKDIKIKRICAYVIDIFIVLILVTLLSQINVLNPYKKKYDKAYEKYTEFYEENFSENTTIDYDTLKSPEYLDIMHDLSYYSISYSIIEIVVIILYFTLFPALSLAQNVYVPFLVIFCSIFTSFGKYVVFTIAIPNLKFSFFIYCSSFICL